MPAPNATTLETQLNSCTSLRPILTSLNGDNAWLLSLPRPAPDRLASGKAYLHIVHDPWLSGPDIQLASWVASVSLSSKPAVADGEEVDALVRRIEEAAGNVQREKERDGENVGVDALLLTFHYGDHMHGPTLRGFRKEIKVFTTKEGEAIVRKLGHFENVSVYPDFNAEEGRDTQGLEPSGLLAPYVRVLRVKGGHELNFLTAMVWSHSIDADEGENMETMREAILSSPHGLDTSTPALQALLHNVTPRFSTLALLHGLKESWVGRWQTTFGARTGQELYRECGARYWVRSHDDRLRYGGVVGWLIKDVFGGVGEGVEVTEVLNGECLVLE